MSSEDRVSTQGLLIDLDNISSDEASLYLVGPDALLYTWNCGPFARGFASPVMSLNKGNDCA